MKVILMCTLLLTSLLAGAAEPGRGEGQGGLKPAIRQEEQIADIARDQTDEGVYATRHWKEYCANPSAKGETALLVVFGGRNSVHRGTGHSLAIPVAIGMALEWTRNQPTAGKIIILVPDMVVERGGGRAGRYGLEIPSGKDLSRLIRARAETHGVKPMRIFGTGFSMGGGLLLTLADDDPTLFARVLVVGASGDAGAVDNITANIKSFHGEDDNLIPLTRVKAYAEALCAKHPDAMQIVPLPGTGHPDSEQAAYSKPEAWEWLLQKEQKTR